MVSEGARSTANDEYIDTETHNDSDGHTDSDTIGHTDGDSDSHADCCCGLGSTRRQRL
jgi:hypothetical protein